MPVAARYLLFAQLVFWSAMLLCVAIARGGLGDNHGFSFYGGRLSTILPYAVGFLVASALIAHAARLLEHSGRTRHAAWLRVLAVLLLADLLTPDTLGSVFYAAHIVASIVLFTFEAAFGLWLVTTVSAAVESIRLFAIQIGGRSARRALAAAVDRAPQRRHLPLPGRVRRASRHRDREPARSLSTSSTCARSMPRLASSTYRW